VRTATDADNDGSQFQYAFFRPGAGQTLLPSEAGGNWLGSTSVQDRLDYLVASSTTGQGNTTWLPVQRWDVSSGGETLVLFAYRRVDLMTQCMAGGQTALCHAPLAGLAQGSYQARFTAPGYQSAERADVAVPAVCTMFPGSPEPPRPRSDTKTESRTGTAVARRTGSRMCAWMAPRHRGSSTLPARRTS